MRSVRSRARSSRAPGGVVKHVIGIGVFRFLVETVQFIETDGGPVNRLALQRPHQSFASRHAVRLPTPRLWGCVHDTLNLLSNQRRKMYHNGQVFIGGLRSCPWHSGGRTGPCVFWVPARRSLDGSFSCRKPYRQTSRIPGGRSSRPRSCRKTPCSNGGSGRTRRGFVAGMRRSATASRPAPTGFTASGEQEPWWQVDLMPCTARSDRRLQPYRQRTAPAPVRPGLLAWSLRILPFGPCTHDGSVFLGVETMPAGYRSARERHRGARGAAPDPESVPCPR